jgi:hypothetical protein
MNISSLPRWHSYTTFSNSFKPASLTAIKPVNGQESVGSYDPFSKLQL